MHFFFFSSTYFGAILLDFLCPPSPLLSQVLCRLMWCLIECGPRGNVVKNDLKQRGAPDALFKVTSVHEGVSPGVMHWANAAKEAVLRRTNQNE